MCLFVFDAKLAANHKAYNSTTMAAHQIQHILVFLFTFSEDLRNLTHANDNHIKALLVFFTFFITFSNTYIQYIHRITTD